MSVSLSPNPTFEYVDIVIEGCSTTLCASFCLKLFSSLSSSGHHGGIAVVVDNNEIIK